MNAWRPQVRARTALASRRSGSALARRAALANQRAARACSPWSPAEIPLVVYMSTRVVSACWRALASSTRVRLGDGPFRGQVAGLDRLAPLPEDAGEPEGGHHDNGRGQAGRGRVPAAPAPGPLPDRDRPRDDRLAGEEPAQVLGQRGGRVVALRRLLLQALQRDRLEVARQAGDQPRRRHRLGVLDLLERLQGGRAPERRAAGQQLVEDRPQGVDVGERPDLLGLALGLLGGHVAGRAHDRVGPRQAAVARPATWPGRSR